MPTKCAIRFTDEERSRWVTVSRDRHGEPDQVILNLADLEELAKATGTHGSPFQVAGQFLFLDTLWYARYHYDPDEFGEVLWEMLSNPNLVPDELAEVLSIHTLGYLDEFDEGWYFDLRIPEGGEWQISYLAVRERIAQDDRGWEYEGRLVDAARDYTQNIE